MNEAVRLEAAPPGPPEPPPPCETVTKGFTIVFEGFGTLVLESLLAFV